MLYQLKQKFYVFYIIILTFSTKSKEQEQLKTYLLPTFQELTYLIVKADKMSMIN